jgi:presenilin-like A22 family membrane protease
MALVEALNAVGVALSSNPSSDSDQQKLGGNLTISALVIQLAVIIIFVVLAGIFHKRCIKAKLHVKAVSTTLVVMYISMLLILIRCIYRLVEHAGNTTVDITDLEQLEALSPLLRYEVYFYIFEATAMLINSVIWNIWHPGRSLPRSSKVHLATDGVTEIIDSEDTDDRPLWAKLVCILSFGILFRRKTKSPSFHQLEDYQTSRT